MNIDILTKILTTTDEYYIGLKRGVTQTITQHKYDDEVIFFSPPQIKRGLKREDISLKDLEQAEKAPILTNIWLSTDYSPFQHGFSLGSLCSIYTIKTNVVTFLKKAYELKSSDLWEYEKLDKEENETK